MGRNDLYLHYFWHIVLIWAVFVWQGFPESCEDEIVSVPDAKYTKGEFEVMHYDLAF